MENLGYSPKDIRFGDQGREKLISGIQKIAGAVKSTLGPRGNTVLIESVNHTGSIIVTKDGVTVAKAVDLLDPVENLAVRMMKEAADKTATNAGDGPQPLYANVLTPNGWKAMGDVQKGDIICGSNGTFQDVEGVFEKGELEVYQVTFSDGRSVECSANHLWTVFTNYSLKKTLTTAELMEDFVKISKDGSYKYKYFVQAEQAEFVHRDFTIDPFLLGMLLGDGSLTGTGSIELSLGIAKKHLIDLIDLPDGMGISVNFNKDKSYYRVKIHGCTSDGKYMRDLIDELGLLGVNSHTKFIPTNYLFSSIGDRQALLNGLISTDGYINKRGLFEFSTVSEQLANDFISLISSLGIAFNKRTHVRDNDKDSYSNNPIFKIAQLQGYKNGNKIVDIKSLGKTELMRCIKVSNDDHLYFTDGFIMTHNTTTAIVLTEALVLNGDSIITPELNRIQVLRHMTELSDQIVESLKKKKKKVTKKMLSDVATISANNDKNIGNIIAKVYNEIGTNGIVTVEKSQTNETYAESTHGFKVQRGYYSPYFINDHKRDECVYEDVMVLVCDAEIHNILQLENILKPIIQEGKRLLIIAPCAAGVVSTMAANVAKGNLKVCAIEPPNFGYRKHELMADIALAVGAKYFSEKTGDDLSLMTYADLGHAAKIIVDSQNTVIINSPSRTDEEALDERVAQLWAAHTEATKKHDKDFILSRIASLTGGVGVIYVGGTTDIEQKELYDRVDDAVCAVRSALEEGILPGAGKALLEESLALRPLESESAERRAAAEILMHAIATPSAQILINAGLDPNSIYKSSETLEPGYGYNVKTGEWGNLIEMGVIDPFKVTRSALQNAVSVATTILSTDAIITMARTYQAQ